MSTIEFNQQYEKMVFRVFPTIRLSPHLASEGENVHISVNDEFLGRADVVAKERYQVDDIHERLLMYDTATDSAEGAKHELKKFYQEAVSDNRSLWIYWFKWTGRYYPNWSDGDE